MSFVGRSEELRRLRSWWSEPGRPALVWGRRRVGKTALIARFATEVPRVVFHTGAGQPAAVELELLSAQVSRVFPGDLRDLATNPYRSWEDALDHLARLCEQEPGLLVLDEFPELMTGTPALPGILRAFLDHSAGRSKLRLLLCGSAVRTMWSIQETRAPLYGRFDLALPVRPFRPHEAAAMLPDLPPAQRALVYGIVGGMPLYLSWWRQQESVRENLLRLAGRPGSPLLTEGRLLTVTEVGAGEQAASVLYAVATGRTRFHEIAEAVGTDPSRVLERLLEARLVERMVPVTEPEHRTRRRSYRIADNFLAFYLGPLLRYRGEIEQGLGESALPALIRSLDNHMGPVWEEAFREHLRRLAVRGDLGDNVVAIGPWWRGDGGDEIDAVVVAQPDHTRVPVAVGEAKWTKRVDARRIRSRLAAKAAAITDDPELLRYLVCAREHVDNAGRPGRGSGGDPAVHNPAVHAITAADIFAPEYDA